MYKLRTKAKLNRRAGTKADSELQSMFQCPALTFGNALLAAGLFFTVLLLLWHGHVLIAIYLFVSL